MTAVIGQIKTRGAARTPIGSGSAGIHLMKDEIQKVNFQFFKNLSYLEIDTTSTACKRRNSPLMSRLKHLTGSEYHTENVSAAGND